MCWSFLRAHQQEWCLLHRISFSLSLLFFLAIYGNYPFRLFLRLCLHLCQSMLPPYLGWAYASGRVIPCRTPRSLTNHPRLQPSTADPLFPAHHTSVYVSIVAVAAPVADDMQQELPFPLPPQLWIIRCYCRPTSDDWIVDIVIYDTVLYVYFI